MDLDISCFKWEPDDKGGGFPAIEIHAVIYTEKEIDTVIRSLLSKRFFLRKQIEMCEGKSK